jgi:hypothetical protein
LTVKFFPRSFPEDFCTRFLFLLRIFTEVLIELGKKLSKRTANRILLCSSRFSSAAFASSSRTLAIFFLVRTCQLKNQQCVILGLMRGYKCLPFVW